MIFALGVVILAMGIDLRRPRLGVPAQKLIEIQPGDFRHAGDEILDRHRLAIEAFEIEIAAAAEIFPTQQVAQHAHHFRPLLVDGQGVEVGNLDVVIRANRVRGGAGIFRELRGAEERDVLDPLDRRRVDIGGKGLVAEDGEALLQRELEPVAASDAIAGPVVEVLMGDDALDALEGRIGCGLRMREHRRRVEDVEPLVLHRPHVEVVDGDDHETVEVVFAAVGLLVPLHGTLERRHGVLGLVEVFRLDPDLQQHVATAHGGVVILHLLQAAGDQREQIAGLGMRVFPGHEVAAIGQLALLHRVAVGEQHRQRLSIADHRGRERRHDVRPIGIEGDPAKAFRLALRTEHAVGTVEPFQRRVGVGIDLDFGIEPETRRHRGHGQLVFVDLELSGLQRLAIDGDTDQLELLAGQFQRQAGLFVIGLAIRVAFHVQARLDPGCGRLEIEGELGVRDAVRRRQIILEIGRLHLRHGNAPCRNE